MDFEQLRAFLEVARHSSFSRAAEKMFRTQPAISAQIRGLEEEIGARLFDRSGGRVTLTTGGKLFQEYAENALQSRGNIIRAVADLESTPRGEVAVGANEATCLYVLPHVFAHFKQQYPRVSVSIVRSERARTIEAVLAQQIDFGVVSLPVNDPRLVIQPIHEDELIVIVPPNHDLIPESIDHSNPPTIPLERVAAYPLLLPKQGRTRDAIDQLLFRQQIAATISMELESSELLKRFVSAGVGVGFVARSSTVADVRAGLLNVIALDGIHISRDLALIYRKDKPPSRAAQAFIDIATSKLTIAATSAAQSAATS